MRLCPWMLNCAKDWSDVGLHKALTIFCVPAKCVRCWQARVPFAEIKPFRVDLHNIKEDPTQLCCGACLSNSCSA